MTGNSESTRCTRGGGCGEDQGGGRRALEVLVRSLGPDQRGGYGQGVARQICGEGKWG